MDSKQARMKELQDLLEQAGRYRELKPIHDQMNAIHRQGQREKFKAAHEGELRQFYMARRKLKDHFTSEGRLPLLSGGRSETSCNRHTSRTTPSTSPSGRT